MKVNSINSLYSNFVVKTPVKETKTIQQEQTTLMNNSLSEAIGRSQVAFKGMNKINQQGNFVHTCIERNGSRENIVYDPKTGNFQHAEYDENGKIIQNSGNQVSYNLFNPILSNCDVYLRVRTSIKCNGGSEFIMKSLKFIPCEV